MNAGIHLIKHRRAITLNTTRKIIQLSPPSRLCLATIQTAFFNALFNSSNLLPGKDFMADTRRPLKKYLVMTTN